MTLTENLPKKRIFSGIQPTGNIHIGNYLGAIRQWINIQKEFDSIFCIVDLHAITVPQDPRALNSKIRETAAILIAAGIDPRASLLFIQSRVSAHAELAWILSCIIPMGWMQRMTQFKEKSASRKKQVSVGLFNYPALMAADILLYDADLVPVGDDQKQHLEMTRNAAKRFNLQYGEILKIPEPMISDTGARIMGLDDPSRKMSKSTTSAGHAINLLDTPDEIYTKIMGAATDSFREIRFSESGPGIRNLLVIYKLFSGEEDAKIEARFSGKGYQQFKKELAELVIEKLEPLQSRYREIIRDLTSIEILLEDNDLAAEAIAHQKLAEIKRAVGIG